MALHILITFKHIVLFLSLRYHCIIISHTLLFYIWIAYLILVFNFLLIWIIFIQVNFWISVIILWTSYFTRSHWLTFETLLGKWNDKTWAMAAVSFININIIIQPFLIWIWWIILIRLWLSNLMFRIYLFFLWWWLLLLLMLIAVTCLF